VAWFGGLTLMATLSSEQQESPVMPQYLVKTLATYELFYEVDAKNEKEAIEASCHQSAQSETLIDEETMGVYLDCVKVFDPEDRHVRWGSTG